MSYRIIPELQCDQCGLLFESRWICLPSGDGRTRPDAAALRADAKAAGWKIVSSAKFPKAKHRGKHDLCEKCARQRKQP
jgi:hypothetical protein